MSIIKAYNKLWAPLHKQLFNQPMTAFRFLSKDRMLQQTTFGNGTVITANFGSIVRKVGEGETSLPAGSYQVKIGEGTEVFSLPDMGGT
ncbi:glycoside hydrolase [Pseudovibrio sp. Tun.PSC04-5.I4]|uniref:glycoside hydrolase n=1 Tax=Pseudovibrio sp. Tun.PSC04-5.I4 TaxID=1798213 RepID=UPI000B872195|nr:glycoside hydrolase [Pseudovibrio sp. Tun.PSC04-5.I4]